MQIHKALRVAELKPQRPEGRSESYCSINHQFISRQGELTVVRAGIYRDFQSEMRIVRRMIRCRRIILMHCIRSIMPSLASQKSIYDTAYTVYMLTPVIYQQIMF